MKHQAYFHVFPCCHAHPLLGPFCTKDICENVPTARRHAHSTHLGNARVKCVAVQACPLLINCTLEYIACFNISNRDVVDLSIRRHKLWPQGRPIGCRKMLKQHGHVNTSCTYAIAENHETVYSDAFSRPDSKAELVVYHLMM